MASTRNRWGAIHDSVKSQIVQVWAVPSKLQPCYLPRFPMSFTLKWMSIRLLNPHPQGGQGQAVRSWLLTRDRTPFLMLETHVGQADFEKLSQWFSARGWQVIGEAAAESVKGGTHGGRIALFPLHMHVHFLHKQFIDGCGWLALQWSFHDLQLTLSHGLHEVWRGLARTDKFHPVVRFDDLCD